MPLTHYSWTPTNSSFSFLHFDEEMDFEKPSSKGSFLKLFDWNVRSKKKLFSSKSESSEMSMSTQKENANANNSTFSRLHQVHENGYSSVLGLRERYNVSNEFSLSNDETYGTKAPGVVARLMGLDSLPVSNNVESCFNQSWDSQSFRRDSLYTAGIPGYKDEECIVNGDRMRNKVDGFGKNPVELTMHSQPTKRFQTEVLPPKSAKPISITHHRLLSPIKTPGFVPTMDVTCLMEAAGKMIEQSPRKRVAQKLPSFGSSSVPFQIQDLKDRVEAVEKSRRISDSSQTGKQRIIVGRVDSPDLLRANRTLKTTSCEDVKRKTTAATLSIQGNANIQKRDGLTSKGDQGSTNLWPQHNEAKAKSKHAFVGRSQEENQKNVLKKTPANRKADVLRQNDQKQNGLSTKEKGSLRPSLLNDKEKKSSSVAPSRPSKRIHLSTDSLSKKENSPTHDLQVKVSSSNSSKKKQELKSNTVSNGGNVASLSRSCNYEIQKTSKRESADQNHATDVVSFTFTPPIKKPVSEATLSGKHVESKRNLFLASDTYNSQSSLGSDMGGIDALSMLLEEKIRELSCQVDASTDSAQTDGTISYQTNSDWNSNSDLPGGKTDTCFTFDECSSSSLSELRLESMQKHQDLDEMKKFRMAKHNEQEPRFGYSMPISSLDLSYSESSCKSLDSARSISSEGWSTNGPYHEEVDTEVSSTSVKTASTRDVMSGFATSLLKDSCSWEFRYIRSLLLTTDLMLEEFALGQVQRIIPLDIFEQLESEEAMRNQLQAASKGDLKQTRKILFDCVEESLESRCLLLFSGDRKHWMKVTMLFDRKDWLADELYREIVSGWTTSNGEEEEVDELVHKDMSSRLGSLINFETEAFEEVVGIGDDILTSLVDEMITELL